MFHTPYKVNCVAPKVKETVRMDVAWLLGVVGFFGCCNLATGWLVRLMPED